MEPFILILLGVAVVIVLIVLILSAVSPSVVTYGEEILIESPIHQVYDDIRIQKRLMRWSAWPKATKSTCAVDLSFASKSEDGQVGVRTVFFSKGKRIGHQEIVELTRDSEVVMTLVGPGPPHKPKIAFKLFDEGRNRTRVLLEFTNILPRPFNAIWRFAGLSKWTRTMHVKDLEGLKAFCEPPHKDADGKIIGNDPKLANPYEVAMPSQP